MKEETRRKRRYPKKWSKDRVKFENRKRDHTPKKPKIRHKDLKDSKKLNKVVGIRR